MGFKEFIAAGVDRCYYAVVGSDGYLLGGTLVAPDAGDTAGSAMLRLRGVISADPTVQESQTVNIPGDNTTQGSFVFGPEESPTFTIQKSVFNLALDALAQGTNVVDRGGVMMGALQPTTTNPPDMCFVLQSPTKKKDVGQNGLKAWSGYIIPLGTATPAGRDSFNTRAGASDRMRVTAQPVDALFDGLEVDETNFAGEGMPIIPFTSDYPLVWQRFTGDGTETDFVLVATPAVTATEGVYVLVDGVVQVLTTDYTVNLATKTISFEAGSVPADGAVIVVRIGMAR